MSNEACRRDFVKSTVTTATALGVVSMVESANSKSSAASSDPSSLKNTLHLQPRYYRWHVDPGVKWVESNTGYATLKWSIPRSQVALVLVDVWDHHYLLDTEQRHEAIIQSKLAPLLETCRQENVRIIHAPSSSIARQQPNWVSRHASLSSPTPQPDWPPRAFRSKSGPYESYRRPAEPREDELVQLRAERKLHPLVQPVRDEPVVANGDELHRYCQEHEILFLMFAGFNANACVLVNDYGTLAMFQRGYEVIIVRDCTTGMESFSTQATQAQTTGAILFLEMFGKYSVTSNEIRTGMKSWHRGAPRSNLVR